MIAVIQRREGFEPGVAVDLNILGHGVFIADICCFALVSLILLPTEILGTSPICDICVLIVSIVSIVSFVSFIIVQFMLFT